MTNPVTLPDGTPFPTLYYLTCPRATAGCSTLEAEGLITLPGGSSSPCSTARRVQTGTRSRRATYCLSSSAETA